MCDSYYDPQFFLTYEKCLRYAKMHQDILILLLLLVCKLYCIIYTTVHIVGPALKWGSNYSNNITVVT